MFSKIRKIKNLIKSAFICTAVTVSILISAYSSSMQPEKQVFDFKSAAIISIGFGASFCMITCNLKKE